jgi:hypothetical protein
MRKYIAADEKGDEATLADESRNVICNVGVFEGPAKEQFASLLPTSPRSIGR